SAASASVAAIAALVWARYPAMTNVELREHLFRNTTRYPFKTDKDGYGTLHAYKAVGGFVGAGISGPTSAEPYSNATFTATTVGDGPFAYRWSNGATSRTATYNVGQYGLWLSVQVTDLYENITREAIHRVEVGGDGGSNPGCDPNLDPRCPA
ncbi:MAG TPA: S8 family serine peptidase, partial [Longimicrobium sp.]|nr:S8 family serine peptidase [Longimicrobium sp.]